MENVFRVCCKEIKIGKIFIYEKGNCGKELIYEKLLVDIVSCQVLLFDLVLVLGEYNYDYFLKFLIFFLK